MTIDEATKEFEGAYFIHDDLHFDDEGRLDTTRAASGDKYITLTSAGPKGLVEPFPGWFSTEEQAIEEWLRQAWLYTDSRHGNLIYWSMRPKVLSVEFSVVDQQAAIQDRDLRPSMVGTLHTVISRLVISKE